MRSFDALYYYCDVTAIAGSDNVLSTATEHERRTLKLVGPESKVDGSDIDVDTGTRTIVRLPLKLEGRTVRDAAAASLGLTDALIEHITRVSEQKESLLKHRLSSFFERYSTPPPHYRRGHPFTEQTRR